MEIAAVERGHLGQDSQDRTVLTGRPDRSAWTDEPGKDRDDGTDSGVKTAMDNVVWAG